MSGHVGYSGSTQQHIKIDELELTVEELRRQLGESNAKQAELRRQCEDQAAQAQAELRDAREQWEAERCQLTELLQATLERQRDFNSQLQDQQHVWEDMDANRAQLEAENAHLRHQLQAMQQVNAMEEGSSEELERHMRELISDLKNERRWRREAQGRLEQLEAERAALLESDRGAQLLDDELDALRLELSGAREQLAELRAQGKHHSEAQGHHSAAQAQPHSAELSSASPSEQRVQRENTHLKKRVAELERRSTLRVPLPAALPQPAQPNRRPPSAGASGDKLRRYYDNVPDSLLSRVEAALGPGSPGGDQAADPPSPQEALRSPGSPGGGGSPGAQSKVVKEETEIALAEAKAMARRMLGDRSGEEEFLGVARRLKRQTRGVQRARSPQRALVPQQHGRVARGADDRQSQKARRPSPHKTEAWQSAIQERAYSLSK